jgi:hypothetical protein
MKTVSLAIVALAVSAGVAVAGDIAAGETVFKIMYDLPQQIR